MRTAGAVEDASETARAGEVSDDADDPVDAVILMSELLNDARRVPAEEGQAHREHDDRPHQASQ